MKVFLFFFHFYNSCECMDECSYYCDTLSVHLTPGNTVVKTKGGGGKKERKKAAFLRMKARAIAYKSCPDLFKFEHTLPLFVVYILDVDLVKNRCFHRKKMSRPPPPPTNTHTYTHTRIPSRFKMNTKIVDSSAGTTP